VAQDRKEIASHERFRPADINVGIVFRYLIHEAEHFLTGEFQIFVPIADAAIPMEPTHFTFQIAPIAQFHVEIFRFFRRKEKIQAECAACRFPETSSSSKAFPDFLSNNGMVGSHLFIPAGNYDFPFDAAVS
jgi:hypothetical protein